MVFTHSKLTKYEQFIVDHYFDEFESYVYDRLYRLERMLAAYRSNPIRMAKLIAELRRVNAIAKSINNFAYYRSVG